MAAFRLNIDLQIARPCNVFKSYPVVLCRFHFRVVRSGKIGRVAVWLRDSIQVCLDDVRRIRGQRTFSVGQSISGMRLQEF
jgi:hypothetical protein